MVFLAVAGQLPDRSDLLGRDETAAQQAAFQQVGQPLTVFHVGLAARDVLHVAGVDQHHLQRVGLAQGVEDRLPKHPGRLHRHLGDPLLDQPAHHLPQHRVERAELTGLLRPRSPGLSGQPNGDRDLLFAHIDCRDALVHDLHDGALPAAARTSATPHPRIRREDQDSEIRAHRQQPGVPTGARSRVNLMLGLNPYQEPATSAGDVSRVSYTRERCAAPRPSYAATSGPPTL